MFNFLNKSNRKIKNIKKQLNGIEKLEENFKNIEEEEIKNTSFKLKNRYKKDRNQKDIIKEASALLKEVTKREFNISLYNVQLITGIALTEKVITEMKTGEGKTFSAMLTAYISFLKGEKIYIATANDYLAKRDAEMVSKVLTKLGVTVSNIESGINHFEKIERYKADVIYGTTILFAFDFLNDNLVLSPKFVTQKDSHSILIDEADLSLIDQARTPLTITGKKDQDDVILYDLFNKNISEFKDKNEEEKLFEIDMESKSITLLESGYNKLEEFLISNNFISKKEEMYISKNLKYLHILSNCLKAHLIYKKDNQYVVTDGEAVIIDEKTGRISLHNCSI